MGTLDFIKKRIFYCLAFTSSQLSTGDLCDDYHFKPSKSPMLQAGNYGQYNVSAMYTWIVLLLLD